MEARIASAPDMVRNLFTFCYTRVQDKWPKRIGTVGNSVLTEPLPGTMKPGQALKVFPSRDKFLTQRFFSCDADTVTITLDDKGVKLSAAGAGNDIINHLVHLPVLKTGFSVSTQE